MCKAGVICGEVADLILRELVHGPLPMETLRLRMVELHDCTLQSMPFIDFIRSMSMNGRIDIDLETMMISKGEQ